ncbi:pyridine nucleotide-disulfide oxidoreductase [Solihabitans fulvus]|uniref:Pyridine nucleotide-disulfide oxidoreductase n=1 Tax=Solihabitans fulvus TaxID=1892852 RepID=A0A5B2XDD9_9PSEU|nr:FAD-dependent oxidoreductase [Solihabitans fulvus]KAA2261194.1 pyridine nucleotide-disulfide oxidoreductase [Solihabitans fulvus]
MQVVIVGAGQAGFQTAASLRQEGFDGRIVLVGDEPHLPYQRPPLSKTYLAGEGGRELVELRPAEFYQDNAIELLTPERIVEIDRTARKVRLESGGLLDYDHLVLALGARNRTLPLPGADLAGVRSLRTLDDADALRAALPSAGRIVVVGGGFIGLEFAVVAGASGAEVTLLEALPRPLARVSSPTVSEFFAEFHRARGVRTVFGAGLDCLVGESGSVTGVRTGEGQEFGADLVVVAVGVLPSVELAEQAGLPTANGILVDERLRTRDPAISAIGDCAAFPTPFAAGQLRLESVQNAVDQARCVAAGLVGRPADYRAVPWFWSDQAEAKLQIAGIITGHDRTVLRGDPATGRFSVFCFDGDRLLGAESVGRAQDHLAVRRLLAAGASLRPDEAGDESFDLKAHAKQAAGR